MKISTSTILRVHLNIGYSSFLLAIDSCLILPIVLFDFFWYFSKGLSLSPAIENLPFILSRSEVFKLLLVFICLLLILPILTGWLTVYLGVGCRWSRIASLRKWLADCGNSSSRGVKKLLIVCAHLTFISLLIFAFVLLKSMELVSGHEFDGSSLGYYFTPVARASIDSIYALVIGSTGLTIASAVLPEFVKKSKAYGAWFTIAYVSSDYYPESGSVLHFNSAAIAPPLLAVQRQLERLLLRYNRLVPGSRLALLEMQKLARDCNNQIRDYLLLRQDRRFIRTDFLPGTSRALEVVLARIPSPKTVITSPYEHPSEIGVINWLQSIDTGVSAEQVNFSSDEYCKPWNQQEDLLIERTTKFLSHLNNNAVLLLSEVSALTGQFIPVGRIMDRLSRCVTSSNGSLRMPRIIIDGAHAAGNYVGSRHDTILQQGWRAEIDSYILSGHKWLMSPEPCGVLLYRVEGRESRKSPYDSWCEEQTVPITTASPRMLAGVLAGLAILRGPGVRQLWSQARDVRNEFLNWVGGSDFELVGAPNPDGQLQSAMVCIRPRNHAKWAFRAERLRDEMEKTGCFVGVVNKDKKNPWVRISFPFFVSDAQLDRLYSSLMSCLRP